MIFPFLHGILCLETKDFRIPKAVDSFLQKFPRNPRIAKNKGEEMHSILFGVQRREVLLELPEGQSKQV
jgi:hypothetical protein